MPQCFTLVIQEDCELVAHTIGSNVHCGGNADFVGDVSVAYAGKCYAQNGAQFQNDLVTFHGGTADVATSPVQFDRYTRFVENPEAVHLNLISSGWVAFGDSEHSYYYDNCITSSPHGQKFTERCVIHVVADSGDLEVNYGDILDKSGLGYQKGQDFLRWCEVDPDAYPVACKRNGQRDLYQDDNEGRRTLVVFKTSGVITLKTDPVFGRKWGPSILAPLATVKLESDFADGSIVAKKLVANPYRTQDQMHGECFNPQGLCF